MGIFSRTRDIVAANFTELLEQADDPAKTIRIIIMEMEETLVEVRASAARTIADQKEMRRAERRLSQLAAEWNDKAELALSKDREDLARGALVEKRKAADMADQLRAEIDVLDDALRAFEGDIGQLQERLSEARRRRVTIAARLDSAENKARLRSLMTHERTDETLARFDQLERQVDDAEGRAASLGLAQNGRTPNLVNELASLEGSDKIDTELAEMKRALASTANKQGSES